MEQKMKKFGVNSTLLLTSLSLVACGGGGSEGYYNNEGSNNNTDNSGNESETDTSLVAESLTVSLRDLDGNVIQQAQDATKVQFAVKVLNADKGGIADQNVVLNISDTDGLGVTSAASKVASGSDGIAIFELDIPTIQADSGKVNLTATVEGTTIQQVYTLNIKKASVIVSDYTLTVPQGTLMNLPAGTADITVQVTDTKGGAKSGQTVQLTLPEAMNGKFSISNGSSITTDSAGQATFTIKANTNLTSTEITNFVNSSQELSFKLVDENQAEKKAVSSITFKDVSTVVNTLEVIPTTEDLAKGNLGLQRRCYKWDNKRNEVTCVVDVWRAERRRIRFAQRRPTISRLRSARIRAGRFTSISPSSRRKLTISAPGLARGRSNGCSPMRLLTAGGAPFTQRI